MISDGILDQASMIASPHFDARPNNTVINMIVIHNISLPAGQYGTDCVEKFFCGTLDCDSDPELQHIAGLRVSAHLFIRRDGEIIQFVNFNDRAWHAGLSLFQGQDKCNDFSIGIELEGTDTESFTKIQYTHLADVIFQIVKNYPDILRERIVGHSDIAPGRKTDPGPYFEWSYLWCLLDALTDKTA